MPSMANFTVKVLSTVSPSLGETMDTLAPAGAAWLCRPSAAARADTPINKPARATRDTRRFIPFSFDSLLTSGPMKLIHTRRYHRTIDSEHVH
ncbi:hypothetical protein D3C81_1710260 [compost metagenome]